ncbi:uncharacterized protein NECHADRAFT_86237 [Fusarium vanettenii 77-13-4]|uniref:DUF7730 domain-containing protein n=1 Tax=Fusarium vanettenii (strain ATCC MYA-4622 / CBS 123669 / FGSC 9596 / NRRL 45880 / 77-13-4) TaxID=660122 RepID=C7ZER4_FUSV7|nr:uncharacterized protein NECHADRAFT_86237 [Fusarium vanettenii 77-13-4]EEU37421.1 hypothetical protein NECHADRAFT_86237 [Fusarium vanettenii 77-13-4]
MRTYKDPVCPPTVRSQISRYPVLGTQHPTPNTTYSCAFMKKTLKKWVIAKLDKLQGKDPTIPRLPDQRKYALTTEYLLASESPFFKKLPYEIRQGILMFAFGNRLIHIDLSLAHPTRNAINANPTFFITNDHCGRARVVWPLSPIDTGKPKCWQWRGCLCHRIPPDSRGDFHDRARNIPQPGDDRCCMGFGASCDQWPGQLPNKCWIGIMGWLLTCRQSYVEGIQVLYATNTIHIASKALLTHIPSVILPQRLMAISSLEISWNIGAHEHEGIIFLNQDDLESILTILFSHFPALRSLHLALKMQVNIQLPVHLGATLRVLDSFVRNTNLKFTVSVTSSVFRQLYRTVRGGITGGNLLFSDYQLWRHLDV